MNKLVTFTRQNGENEYTEFSYFTVDGLTDADYINEVYYGYDDLTEMEGKHRDTLTTNKEAYWFGDELISIHKVDDITDEELTVLRKFWIV
jgi:hypothetical protein